MTETTKVIKGEESAKSWFTTYTVFARQDDAPPKSDAEAATDNAEAKNSNFHKYLEFPSSIQSGRFNQRNRNGFKCLVKD